MRSLPGLKQFFQGIELTRRTRWGGEGRGECNTSNAGRQCNDLRSLSLADVRARGHPEVVSARLVQFGCLVSELIGRHLLAARLLRVVRLRVHGVLGDDSIRLAGRPPRNQDRFGRHDESLDRDRRFGGWGGERKEKVGFAISRKTFRLTILFGLAVDRRGLDSIAARSESQDLHAVVRVLLQSVQNGLARGGDLGVLGVLVVPGVGGSVDNLYIRLQYLNNLRFNSSI